MRIEKLPIDKLRPADYNPRRKLKPGDPAYEKLRRSIVEYGYIEPVIYNKQTGHVVGGHQRLQVLHDLGYKEVEAVVVDLPPAKEKALNIALNKISGDWNMPKLKDLLESLAKDGMDLSLTGFDVSEASEILGGIGKVAKEDNFDVDAAVEAIRMPVTRPGDIWQLGSHRLLCGDSTKSEQVRALLAGDFADMIFTDPPYNVDYIGKTKDKLKIKNDKMKDGDFYQFLTDAFAAMFVVTKPGGAIYVCHADSEGLNFRVALKAAGWDIKQCLVWVKNVFVMGRQDYQWQHEPILYGWKPGAAHKWRGRRKQSTVIDDLQAIAVSRHGDKYRLEINADLQTVVLEVPEFAVLDRRGAENSAVWYFDKPVRSSKHPTMKPIALVARALANSSDSGDIVLDTFGGSGSTLIAAEQLSRRCYAVELDPVYCDVIIQRWEALTGGKAERITVI